MATPTDNPASAADLLNAAYRQLEFDQGALLSAARTPQPAAGADWIDRGDWQLLAAQVGAESIFFVDRDPVVVFAKAENVTEGASRALYERVWCMSRPQLLFLATPGQLSAFDLTKPPPRPHENIAELRAADEAIVRAEYSDTDASATQFRAKIERIAVNYRDGRHRLDLANASPAELLAFAKPLRWKHGDEATDQPRLTLTRSTQKTALHRARRRVPRVPA
jgi:hypothetical protein